MWFRSKYNRRRLPARGIRFEPLEDRRLLTLNPATHYNVGDSPLDMVSGDFNGDGAADLATINATHLSLLLGNGDGTFGSAQHSSAGSGLRGLAAADLNGDSRVDLIITRNGTEGFVRVLLNDGADAGGNVAFQAPRDFSTGGNTMPGAIAVGDLNGDGKLDVAAVQAGGSNVTVLLGSGDGNLQGGGQFALGGSDPGAIALGDLNGDNKLDLVTSNRASSNVSVLLNNGNDVAGNVIFQGARNTSLYGFADGVAVGDFDANGKLDLAATSSVPYYGYYGGYYGAAGYVNVLLGNGDGTFAAAQTTWANNSRLGEVAAADFNGDGKLDVATPDGFVQPMRVDPTVLLGRGDGTFDSPYHFDGGYGPIALVATDLSGDTAPDVSVANIFSGNVSVLINDQNWPPVGAPFVNVNDVWITEGNTGTLAATFRVSLSAGFNLPISIDYSTADVTATAGSDYQATSGTLTFTPGGSLTQDVTVLINGDRLAEPGYWSSELFYFNLTNPSNVRIGDGLGTGNIQDNEPRPTIGSYAFTEGNSGTTNAVIPITLQNNSDGPVTVNWSTNNGSALAGSDYQTASGTLTFNLGGPTTQNVTVPIIGDRIGEYQEWFQVALSSGDSATQYVNDNEPLFSINNASVTEGNTGSVNAVFTVSIYAPYDEAVTVNFAASDNVSYGWAATAGSDFVANSGVLTFAAGQTSKTVTVVVQGDTLVEATETFSVDLTDPSPNASLYYPHGTGTILDNEPSASVDYGTIATEGNTGTRSAVFTVRLATTSSSAVSVDWSTSDGSANAGSDYENSFGTVTFNAGVQTQTVSVPIIGDRLPEYDEYFYLNLGNGASASGSIADDEPYIRIGDVVIAEGNTGSKNAVFTVNLSRAYDQPVSVNFSTAEGDTEAWWGWGYWGYYYPPPAATAGSDFESANGSLSFAAGETSKSITIAILGDRAVEDDEYFSVNLSNPSANARFDDAHAVGIIADDEPRLSINSTSVTEGNTGTTNAVFTVTLSAPSDQPVTVGYSTANGSALAGNDYTAASGSLTFTPGETLRTITVAVTGDTRDEYDEYFSVNLNAASGAMLVGSYGSATIVDNDPSPSLSISDASVTEGNSGTKLMVFTVRLSAASDKGVSVNYVTENGTAKKSDKDFGATSGSLYFAPGETLKTISIVINGDKRKEKNETFYVNLLNAVDAVFADAKGLGTILNDD